MFEVLAGVMSANTSRERSIVCRDRKRILTSRQLQCVTGERENKIIFNRAIKMESFALSLYLDLSLVGETYFEQAGFLKCF